MRILKARAGVFVEWLGADATRRGPPSAVKQTILHAPAPTSFEQQVDVVVTALVA
jgi:hypothetical protein